MIRPILITSLLVSCLGAEIKLAWDRNQEPDLAGYRLYWAQNGSTNFVRIQEITNETVHVVITNRTAFYVTAFNTSMLESLPSNILVVNPDPPKSPSGLKLTELIMTYKLP